MEEVEGVFVVEERTQPTLDWGLNLVESPADSLDSLSREDMIRVTFVIVDGQDVLIKERYRHPLN